jgi:hypothetical protein
MAERKRLPRVFYIFLGIAALLLVTGFTIGALTLGGFGSSPRQANAQVVIPGPPAGLTFPLDEATFVTASSSPAAGACTASNLGTPADPTPLVSGENTTICMATVAGGFALGDTAYILDLEWNTTAAISTTFEVQVFVSVSPSAHDVLVTSYVNTTATISAPEIATYAIDLTAADDTGVTGFNVLVTQLAPP